MKSYPSKCPFCKKLKPDVYMHFMGNTGCIDCADKYFKNLLGSDKIMKDPAITEYLKREAILKDLR